MTGPSSAPSPERPRTRPAAFEAQLLFTGEQLVDNEDHEQQLRANRATRRAAQHRSGPPCGNNPNYPLGEVERQAIADFLAYLANRRPTNTEETENR